MLPFTAGEVNVVMQPASSGSASVTVLVDERAGDVSGAPRSQQRTARFDRSGMFAWWPCVVRTARADPGHELFWCIPSVRIHFWLSQCHRVARARYVGQALRVP